MEPRKKTPKEKQNLAASLKRLADIVGYFERQEEVDVEEGLRRVKEGASLIKELRVRLRAIENEFKDIKDELASDDA